MSDVKFYTFIVAFAIATVFSALTVIFVAVPKNAFIEARVSSRMMDVSREVNKCSDEGMAAYITKSDRVLCERIKDVK